MVTFFQTCCAGFLPDFQSRFFVCVWFHFVLFKGLHTSTLTVCVSWRERVSTFEKEVYLFLYIRMKAEVTSFE